MSSKLINTTNTSKIAIVAGNAPSLNEIDYSRVPVEFDLFRCNQYYFEKNYTLGNKIKYAFYNPSVFLEQFYTARHLQDNGDYEIENIVCSSFSFFQAEIASTQEYLAHVFPEVLIGGDIIAEDKKLTSDLAFQDLFYSNRVTSGLYMCIIACLLGYKTIYIAGIDLYADGATYAFQHGENLIKLIPQFSTDDSKCAYHNTEFDVKMLGYLAERFQVEFYSVCPTSPISKFIPLAPQQCTQQWTEDKGDIGAFVNSDLVATVDHADINLSLDKFTSYQRQRLYYPKSKQAILDVMLPTNDFNTKKKLFTGLTLNDLDKEQQKLKATVEQIKLNLENSQGWRGIKNSKLVTNLIRNPLRKLQEQKRKLFSKLKNPKD